MADRKCRTCKHFEPSPIRRKGWCRNPLLYSPQQSHLVHQDDLDCGHRLGNYWEPAESPEEAEPQPAGAEVKPEAAPLRFMTTEPQPATAAAGMVAWASSSGSGGNPLSSSGGSSGSGGGRVPGSGSGGAGGGGGVPPLSGRPGGPGRPGGGQGPERSVSYQPEERYWTDYLRIAFPVLGLLLLLGLFWFWAMALIDNDDDNGGNTGGDTTPAATATTPSGAAGPTVDLSRVEGTPGDSETENPTPTEEGARPPTRTPRTTEEDTPTPAESVGQFQEDDVVVTTEADVNLRSDPSLDGDIVTTLEEGTELTVTGESVEADEFIWVPVEDADGNEGWVAEQFLASAEE
jgi:hypothetical protein